MSREESNHAYQQAWENFYSTEHVTTVMKRAAALHGFGATLFAITWFKCSIEIENVHPLESGFLRMKFRRDRRPALPREPVWSFYPKFFAETVVKNIRWIYTYLRLRRIYLKIKRDPKRYEYRDLAITPVTDDEIEFARIVSECCGAGLCRSGAAAEGNPRRRGGVNRAVVSSCARRDELSLVVMRRRSSRAIAAH